MMETCCWALLAVGAATTAARAGWIGPRAILGVAAAWAAAPWLSGDIVAGRSAAALIARASRLDVVGSLATLVATEALIGGWTAMVLSGGGWRGVEGRRIARWASLATAVIPSPSLAFGIIGVQASLYHRASGWSFSAVDAGLSAALFAAIAGSAGLGRLVQPELARRAAGAVALFAAQFVLGAALVPLLDARPRGTRAVEVDFWTAVAVAALAAAGIGFGAASRLVRSRVASSRGGIGEHP